MATTYIPADGFYGYGTNNGAGYLRFVVDRSYDPAANKSTLSIGLQAHGSSTIYAGSYTLSSGAVSAGGTTLQTFNSNGYTVQLGNSGNANTWYDVMVNGAAARWTHVVQHAADGAASVALAIGGSFTMYRYVSATVGGKNVRFDAASDSLSFAEARASAIASCPGSVTTQGGIALSVSRASPAYYHKATVKDSLGRTLYGPSAAFETSLTIPVPRTWFQNYGSAASFAAAVSVQTYTDSGCTVAVGGAVTAPVTVAADSGMVPTLASGFAAAAALGNPSGFSGCIQGVSRARVTLDASKVTHAAGASLSSYTVVCQGYTGSGAGTSYDTNVLTGAEAVPITVTVTDSRGRTASQSLTVTPMAYAPPTLSGVSVFRCASGGAASEDGTYYSAKATAACSGLNGQNSVTLTARCRLAGGSWSGAAALTSGTARVLGGSLSPDSSYEVELTAADALGSVTTYTAALTTRQWAMKFRDDGNGVAFGKAPEYGAALELPEDWKLRFGSKQFSPVVQSVAGSATSNSYGSVYVPTAAYNPLKNILIAVIIESSPGNTYKPLPFTVSASMLGFRVMNYATTSSNGVANIAVTYRIYYLPLE